MRILCRLGLHRWYIDGSIFTSAERCNFCPAVSDQARAEQLDRERRLWTEEKQRGGSFDEVAARVSARLFGLSPDPAR